VSQLKWDQFRVTDHRSTSGWTKSLGTVIKVSATESYFYAMANLLWQICLYRWHFMKIFGVRKTRLPRISCGIGRAISLDIWIILQLLTYKRTDRGSWHNTALSRRHAAKNSARFIHYLLWYIHVSTCVLCTWIYHCKKLEFSFEI